eukprot:1158621-Pelagomonas_calceolata.AAC.5
MELFNVCNLFPETHAMFKHAAWRCMPLAEMNRRKMRAPCCNQLTHSRCAASRSPCWGRSRSAGASIEGGGSL